jgi:flagellar FliL protein
MAEEAAKKEDGEKKRSPLPIIIGAVALLGGLGGGIVVDRTFLSAAPAPAEGEEAADEGGHGEEAEASASGGHGEEAKAEEDEGGGGHGGGGGAAAVPASDVKSVGSFSVNLRDSGGGRLLLMEISLEVPGAKAQESVVKKEAQLRDAIIVLASDYTYLELDGLEGKMRLKDEVLKPSNAVLAPEKVERVYFTNFVIQ